MGDDEGSAAGIGEREIHGSFGIGEDSEVDYFLGETRRLGLGVVVGHTDKHTHSRANLSDTLSRLTVDHVNVGLADPLNQCAHALSLAGLRA